MMDDPRRDDMNRVRTVVAEMREILKSESTRSPYDAQFLLNRMEVWVDELDPPLAVELIERELPKEPSETRLRCSGGYPESIHSYVEGNRTINCPICGGSGFVG